MRDLDIRRVLRRDLEARFAVEREALILDEFSLCCGIVRADIAVINGELKGFEIKSEKDNLLRLAVQAHAYGRIFDTVTLVTASRHLEKARGIVPSWWGIFVAVTTFGPNLQIECYRPEGTNPVPDPLALVQLIWRDEAVDLLQEHNLLKNGRRRPRKFLWEALANNIELSKLQELVRNKLKARKNWRSASSRTRYERQTSRCNGAVRIP
jgi:hypothetical protein